MSERIVFCQKHQKEGKGLERVPYPGELGKRIYESICLEAWQQWLRQQTLLINENRLNVLDPKSRTFLEEEMVKFLFEGKSEMPAGYKPIEQK